MTHSREMFGSRILKNIVHILKVQILKVHILKAQILKVQILKVQILKVNILKVQILNVQILKVHIFKVQSIKIQILKSNQNGVLFQLTYILNSLIQVKLMNVITSFISLSTIVVRFITIQVLHSYLQAQLGYKVQSNLSRCVQVYIYGIYYGMYYKKYIP